MINVKNLYNKFFLLILFVFIFYFFYPFVTSANEGVDCLTSYRDICLNDSGDCKANWASGCDYCEADNIEYQCELPSGGSTAYCGFAEKCVITVPPPPSDCPNVGTNNFVGCYLDMVDYSENPFIRTDPVIDFNWGVGNPDPSMTSDYFSVKWEGDFNFATDGVYKFHAMTDDGMRVYVDGNIIIDEWYDQGFDDEYVANVNLFSGMHLIKVEYYEKGGDAAAKVWWTLEGETNPPGDPMVIGPSTGVSGVRYWYSFKSTDPDGDQVRYGVDWTDLDGVTYSSTDVMDGNPDFWWPESGYFPSGVESFISQLQWFKWPTIGIKKFQVITEDESGFESDWVTKTITISQLNSTISADQSNVGPGDPVLVTFGNVHDPTDGDWIGVYLTSAENGTQEISYVYTPECGQSVGGTPREDGSCTMQMPMSLGDYNFRLYYRNDLGDVIATSNTVTVSEGGVDNYNVTVTVPQMLGGKVISIDSIIDTSVCSSPCVKAYSSGSSITLQAIPSSSYWKFNGWSGGCSGTGSCVISVSSDINVSASFTPRLFFYKES